MLTRYWAPAYKVQSEFKTTTNNFRGNDSACSEVLLKAPGDLMIFPSLTKRYGQSVSLVFSIYPLITLIMTWCPLTKVAFVQWYKWYDRQSCKWNKLTPRVNVPMVWLPGDININISRPTKVSPYLVSILCSPDICCCDNFVLFCHLNELSDALGPTASARCLKQPHGFRYR